MFGLIKKSQEIEKLEYLSEQIAKQQEDLEKSITELRKEKQELQDLKEFLTMKQPKIDISDIYIFQVGKLKYIVKYRIFKDLKKVSILDASKYLYYQSILIDIFNNEKVYEVYTEGPLKMNEYFEGWRLDTQVKLTPILEVEPDLLAYMDRQVPLYVLQQLFYKLNKVDTKNPILQKTEKR